MNNQNNRIKHVKDNIFNTEGTKEFIFAKRIDRKDILPRLWKFELIPAKNKNTMFFETEEDGIRIVKPLRETIEGKFIRFLEPKGPYTRVELYVTSTSDMKSILFGTTNIFWYLDKDQINLFNNPNWPPSNYWKSFIDNGVLTGSEGIININMKLQNEALKTLLDATESTLNYYKSKFVEEGRMDEFDNIMSKLETAAESALRLVRKTELPKSGEIVYSERPREEVGP